MSLHPGHGAPTRDPTPAYWRIFQTLRRRIAGGTYPVAGQLPTEETLMREFGVSRHTVRAAVQQLVSQALVTRQAGRGTFVLNPEAESQHWAAQSLEDMVDRGFGGRLEQAALAMLEGPAAAAIAARLALPAGAPVACFSWLRSGRDGPYAFARVHIAGEHAGRLPADWAARLQTTRLLHMLEDACAVHAHRARQVSAAVAADADLAARLQVAPATPLLRLERTYFTRAGMPLEYACIHGRPDRYQQTVELFRAERRPPAEQPASAATAAIVTAATLS
jgi:GntR family transcriptional regulator